MNKFLKFFLPPILWAGIIFWNSSLPRPPIPQIEFNHFDKILHFGAYFILGYLTTRAWLVGKREKRTMKIYFISALIGILYGLSDEFHQYFVPGRSSEWSDWLADSLGIIGAQFMIHFQYKIFPERWANMI